MTPVTHTFAALFAPYTVDERTTLCQYQSSAEKTIHIAFGFFATCASALLPPPLGSLMAMTSLAYTVLALLVPVRPDARGGAPALRIIHEHRQRPPTWGDRISTWFRPRYTLPPPSRIVPGFRPAVGVPQRGHVGIATGGPQPRQRVAARPPVGGPAVAPRPAPTVGFGLSAAAEGAAVRQLQPGDRAVVGGDAAHHIAAATLPRNRAPRPPRPIRDARPVLRATAPRPGSGFGFFTTHRPAQEGAPPPTARRLRPGQRAPVGP